MPGGMEFTRHAPGQVDGWDFNPGSRLLTLNDLRIDAETRQLILDMFELPDAELILEVADIIAGTGVTVTNNGNGTVTISMDPTASPAFAEAVRDTMGTALDGGVGVTVTPNDPGDLLTITLDLTDPALLEAFRDAVGTMLTAGTGISVTVNDGADTITLASTVDAEFVRDTMGTALVAGGNVTITPNDGADTITIAAALTGSAGDAEVIRDTIGSALVAGTGMTITVNDPSDTITITLDTTGEAERIRDTIGTAIVGGTGVTSTVDDNGDTITLSHKGKPVNDQTASYTLVAADAGKWVTMNNASANNLTVPQNVFAVGDEIEGHQKGAGQTTIVAGTGTTVNGLPGLKVAAQYGVFGIKCVASNTFVAYGRLSA